MNNDLDSVNNDYLESINNAKRELKRADHSIYVSLKYTRTVEVIKHIVARLISASDFVIEALLLKAKEEDKISEIPDPPKMRCEVLKKAYPENEEILKYITYYLLLRAIDKAEFVKSREYRRHVTMTAHLEGRTLDVDIDRITEYFKRTVNFVDSIERMLKGEEENA